MMSNKKFSLKTCFKQSEEEPEIMEPVKKNGTPFKLGKALLVGINYYGTDAKLNGCINDVNNVYRYLTTIEKFDPENIRILTDEPHSPPQKSPTRANIVREIGWLTSDMIHNDIKDKPDVSLFMHYSGHGSWVWDRNSEEKDRKDETICPVDYHKSGFIKDDQLRRILVDPIANKPHIRLTALFDCCHSGTVLDLRYETKIRLNVNKPNQSDISIRKNKKYKGSKSKIFLFSGSMDKQYSADAYINRQSQGAMTYGFLTIIRQLKARRLTYKKFITHLQALLKKSGYDQIPQLSTNHFPNLKELYDV